MASLVGQGLKEASLENHRVQIVQGRSVQRIQWSGYKVGTDLMLLPTRSHQVKGDTQQQGCLVLWMSATSSMTPMLAQWIQEWSLHGGKIERYTWAQ